jgi:hypothetical protein
MSNNDVVVLVDVGVPPNPESVSVSGHITELFRLQEG